MGIYTIDKAEVVRMLFEIEVERVMRVSRPDVKEVIQIPSLTGQSDRAFPKGLLVFSMDVLC